MMRVNFSKSELKGLNSLMSKSNKAFNKGMKVAGVVLLRYMNEGSPGESRTPPEKEGGLISSSSVFKGNKLLDIGPLITGNISQGTEVSPLMIYAGRHNVLTWVYNTSYATRMHEWRGGWGAKTLSKNDAGNKWMELHIKHDKEALINIIGGTVRKELGL